MILFRWRCWLRAIWYAITNPPTLTGPFAGAFISGHSMVETEDMAVPAFVDVIRCEDCGAVSVGWRRSLADEHRGCVDGGRLCMPLRSQDQHSAEGK